MWQLIPFSTLSGLTQRVSHMPLAPYIYSFPLSSLPISVHTTKIYKKYPFLYSLAFQNLKQIKTKVSVQRNSHQFFCCIWLIHREMITPVHGISRAGCSGAGRLLSKSVRLHPGTWRFRFYRRWPPLRRPQTIKIWRWEWSHGRSSGRRKATSRWCSRSGSTLRRRFATSRRL